jgi:hypothetical protein
MAEPLGSIILFEFWLGRLLARGHFEDHEELFVSRIV